MKRVVLVDLARPHRHIEDACKDLAELQNLVKTYGGIDVVHIIQHRTRPDQNTFIGSGKMAELLNIVRNKKIDIVVINAIVKPTQLFNIIQTLWATNPGIAVWDRVDLILHIFEKHAKSAESKLQIELARMKHMGPRMYGLGGSVLSRQGGGIGTRGIGETNVERMKRHWRKQIKVNRDELEKLHGMKKSQITRRSQAGVPTAAIIGYTNAGKTSLFNLLTGKEKYAKDKLFATLESVSGTISKNLSPHPILLSDTIGFIRDLPPELVETFRTTLLEAIHADVLIHVIDSSDEKLEEHHNAVNTILDQIFPQKKPTVIVLNKYDLCQTSHLQTLEIFQRRARANTPHSPVG